MDATVSGRFSPSLLSVNLVSDNLNSLWYKVKSNNALRRVEWDRGHSKWGRDYRSVSAKVSIRLWLRLGTGSEDVRRSLHTSQNVATCVA